MQGDRRRDDDYGGSEGSRRSSPHLVKKKKKKKKRKTDTAGMNFQDLLSMAAKNEGKAVSDESSSGKDLIGRYILCFAVVLFILHFSQLCLCDSMIVAYI